MSTEDAVAAFTAAYGQVDTIEKSASLVKTLYGKPILDEIVRVTDKANANSERWQDLLEQYVQEKDSSKKRLVMDRMASLQARYPDILVDFHNVLGKVSAGMNGFVKRLYLAIAILVGGVLAAAAFFIAQSITTPLKRTVDFAEAMSKGDFRNRLDINNRDELGKMADAFNAMSFSLRDMMKGIIGGIDTINTSSAELSGISQSLSDGARASSDQSNSVQAASGKMSEGMSSIASAMAQSATNVNMVAASAEEMSSTISEISQNAEKARSISDEAAGQAAAASSGMNELGQAAQSIGKVIQTIADISEQVNLLALNATIEAARAGEAGKGFAVVANEIKELAGQTASAAQDIRSQIENIQVTTGTTLEQMQSISQVIDKVNDIVAGIASAVEEQSAATKEIAGSIGQASQGIQEVNVNVSESSVLAADISTEISGVHHTAENISGISAQVNSSAQDLAGLSQDLKKLVDPFQV